MNTSTTDGHYVVKRVIVCVDLGAYSIDIAYLPLYDSKPPSFETDFKRAFKMKRFPSDIFLMKDGENWQGLFLNKFSFVHLDNVSFFRHFRQYKRSFFTAAPSAPEVTVKDTRHKPLELRIVLGVVFAKIRDAVIDELRSRGHMPARPEHIVWKFLAPDSSYVFLQSCYTDAARAARILVPGTNNLHLVSGPRAVLMYYLACLRERGLPAPSRVVVIDCGGAALSISVAKITHKPALTVGAIERSAVFAIGAADVNSKFHKDVARLLTSAETSATLAHDTAFVIELDTQFEKAKKEFAKLDGAREFTVNLQHRALKRAFSQDQLDKLLAEINKKRELANGLRGSAVPLSLVISKEYFRAISDKVGEKVRRFIEMFFRAQRPAGLGAVLLAGGFWRLPVQSAHVDKALSDEYPRPLIIRHRHAGAVGGLFLAHGFRRRKKLMFGVARWNPPPAARDLAPPDPFAEDAVASDRRDVRFCRELCVEEGGAAASGARDYWFVPCAACVRLDTYAFLDQCPKRPIGEPFATVEIPLRGFPAASSPRDCRVSVRWVFERNAFFCEYEFPFSRCARRVDVGSASRFFHASRE
eukprot:gnl/Chilomastix_cuspidata/3741.p1 GENE.gnl/Chilomastix_cuspidata/3741~~gnl/Chilomastix_cuspidata/3741.p1  ORF type:complete len:585 (+),score=268.62 gnl/Chilomastix_cuspidata/3741:407-2161(+)